MSDDPRKDLDDALDAPLEDRLRAALDKVREEGDESKLDELERQLFELGEGVPSATKAQEELNQIEDEFDARMRRLQEKSTAVQQEREAQIKQEQRERASDGKAAKGLGLGLSIAYSIIGMPILGYVIGWAIDGKPGGPNGAWPVLVGSVLGIVGAVMIMKRAEN